MVKDRFSVIIDALRSPMGTKRGKMVGIRPDDLTAQVLKGLLKRNSKLPLEKIEDVILGCAFPEGPQGMLMARSVAVLAGIPKEAGAKVVNRFCGSSMDAVHQADYAITLGDADAIIAAGVEDMLSVPMGGYNPSFNPELVKKNFYMGMGETAENLAKEGNISRKEQEEFAVLSHQKALDAKKNGRFENEIVPINHNGEVIKHDEGPREPDVEKMKSLKPAFLQNGTVTAATSSPFTIGAAGMLLTSNTLAKELGLKPRARILSRAFAGVEWEKMGMGPLPATEKALKRAGLTMKDIEVIELNEAFAAQALYVIKKGGWPMEKVNLNGGAVALGHPLGCSGARILTALINIMEQKNAKIGLATMCIGTGQGIATIIERM
jgi:acetyl-CoA acetyltransferase family protein